MACGYCSSQSSVETEMQAHFQGCSRDLPTTQLGDPSIPRHARRELVKSGARYGAEFGRARGPNGVLAGGVIGAALGALTSHIFDLPELRPAIDFARGLHGHVADVMEVVKGKKE